MLFLQSRNANVSSSLTFSFNKMPSHCNKRKKSRWTPNGTEFSVSIVSYHGEDWGCTADTGDHDGVTVDCKCHHHVDICWSSRWAQSAEQTALVFAQPSFTASPTQPELSPNFHCDHQPSVLLPLAPGSQSPELFVQEAAPISTWVHRLPIICSANLLSISTRAAPTSLPSRLAWLKIRFWKSCVHNEYNCVIADIIAQANSVFCNCQVNKVQLSWVCIEFKACSFAMGALPVGQNW